MHLLSHIKVSGSQVRDKDLEIWQQNFQVSQSPISSYPYAQKNHNGPSTTLCNAQTFLLSLKLKVSGVNSVLL